MASLAFGVGLAAVADDGATAPQATSPAGGVDATDGLEQFESRGAFVRYVRRGKALARDSRLRHRRPDRRRGATEVERAAASGGDADAGTLTAEPMATATQAPERAGSSAGASTPDRVAGTNVQVTGIDEPDLVKADGNHLYYSAHRTERPHGRPRTGERDTHVLSVERPASPEAIAAVDATGRLLRVGDRLVVIGADRVRGYDVSDPADPKLAWERGLGAEVVTARLVDGTVYLVTRSRVDLDRPCPVEPVDGAAVPCTEVHRPAGRVAVDATYTALSLSPSDGAVGETTSFVGTADTTAVYVSGESLYVTYTEATARAALRLSFLLDTQQDRLPAGVVERLRRVQGLNISGEAKRVEARRAVEGWLATLDRSERERVRSALRNDWRSYLGDRRRDLVRTGVVRVAVDGLTVETVGSVPGRPLNQFSLSEREGTLRVATTVPAAGDRRSSNDLYTLDSETLERQGAVTGMGEGQRVYAVRYVGDTAYVVTFRRVDPLHVVDLSDPAAPEERGTLELPGFSEYLHPIDDDTVVGVGEEDGRVKAVLFDVSDPTDPRVADDHVLDSRWSAVSESHHAFLLDRKHGVVFLPTGEGGRVLDYTGGDLGLEHSVDTPARASRARYVGDSLYVFAGDTVTVVDERTWNQTAHLDLG